MKTVSNTQTRLVLDANRNWLDLDLSELWQYREMLFFLTWRDIKVRYKQTVLGAAWAILQPLLTMVIFSIIFGVIANLPSEGIPYPIFTYSALLPWQLFAFALTQSSNSLIGSQNLVSKVYFPRLIIPIASILPALVDFAVAFVVLLGMMFFYQIPISTRVLALPLFLLLAVASALAVGLWFSALNVKYRDIRYVVPFLAMFWQYATPVAYSSTLIPDRWQFIYALNPMTSVVEGFRWALLGTESNLDGTVWASAGVVILLLFGGLIYFKRMEDTFADVI